MLDADAGTGKHRPNRQKTDAEESRQRKKMLVYNWNEKNSFYGGCNEPLYVCICEREKKCINRYTYIPNVWTEFTFCCWCCWHSNRFSIWFCRSVCNAKTLNIFFPWYDCNQCLYRYIYTHNPQISSSTIHLCRDTNEILTQNFIEANFSSFFLFNECSAPLFTHCFFARFFFLRVQNYWFRDFPCSQ